MHSSIRTEHSSELPLMSSYDGIPAHVNATFLQTSSDGVFQ
jgi:hypothetical protein